LKVPVINSKGKALSGRTAALQAIGFLLLEMIFQAPSPAWSVQSMPIEIEWEYTPPTTKYITYYQLYQEGAPVCRFTPSDITNMSCRVYPTPGVKSATFTLDAHFSDGSKSPLSPPYQILLSLNTSQIMQFLLLDDPS